MVAARRWAGGWHPLAGARLAGGAARPVVWTSRTVRPMSTLDRRSGAARGRCTPCVGRRLLSRPPPGRRFRADRGLEAAVRCAPPDLSWPAAGDGPVVAVRRIAREVALPVVCGGLAWQAFPTEAWRAGLPLAGSWLLGGAGGRLGEARAGKSHRGPHLALAGRGPGWLLPYHKVGHGRTEQPPRVCSSHRHGCQRACCQTLPADVACRSCFYVLRRGAGLVPSLGVGFLGPHLLFLFTYGRSVAAFGTGSATCIGTWTQPAGRDPDEIAESTGPFAPRGARPASPQPGGDP